MAVDLGSYGRPRGEPPPEPPEPAAPPARRPRRARPRAVLAVALAVLLVGDVAVVVAHGLLGQDASADPRTAVLALVAALQRGDGPAAARAVVAPAGASRLTAADADAQTAYAASVVTVRRSGDTAVVELAYDTGVDVVAGGTAAQPARSRLTLTRTPGSLLTAPRWRVTGGLPVLQLSAPGYERTALVDGRPLPLTAGHAEVTVFPGRVAVGLPAAAPAAALSAQVGAASAAPAAVLAPGVDAATQEALGQAVSYRVIPGGEVQEGPNSVHPSHVDLDAVTLDADGRTLRFHGVLDMLVRAQLAYDAPTLALLGTATYAAGGAVTVTSLRVTPLSSAPRSPAAAPAAS